MLKRIDTKKLRPLVLIQFFVLGLVCLTLGTPVQAESPQDVLIIANKSVKVDSISLGELKAVFLKKKSSVSGSKVVPVNAKKGTTLRRTFQARVLGMSTDDESEYWQGMKIKTGTTPAVEFSNPLKAVRSIRGGIGYCYRSQYKEGLVKILNVL